MGAISMENALQKKIEQETSDNGTKKEIHVVNGIEYLWLDNVLFRYARRIVFSLDNYLFNRNGSAGPGYQPNRHVLIIPYYFGLVASFIIFVTKLFSSGKTSDLPTPLITFFGIVYLILFVAFFVSLVVSCRNVLVFRDWKRKVLYVLFIVACSYLCFYITLFIGIAILLIVFLVLMIIFALYLLAIGLKTSFSTDWTGINFKAKETWQIVDGSFMGVTLTRVSMDEYKDGAGNTYRDTGHGSVYKV